MKYEFLKKTFDKARSRGWDRVYWAVDIHDTVMPSSYDGMSPLYEEAEGVLKYLSEREDCVLILFSCLTSEDEDKYLRYFESKGIHFDYVNENPEIENTSYASFDKKFYTNFYLDDKAGFDYQFDWNSIYCAMQNIPTLCENI